MTQEEKPRTELDILLNSDRIAEVLETVDKDKSNISHIVVVFKYLDKEETGVLISRETSTELANLLLDYAKYGILYSEVDDTGSG